MSILKKIKPKFWDHHDLAAGPKKNLFSFRRKWKLMVIATTLITLTPLVFITLVEYNLTRNALESEIRLRTTQLVSNTWRSISFFLTERKSAMNFVLEDNAYEALHNRERLREVLENLHIGIGGFVDLGILDIRDQTDNGEQSLPFEKNAYCNEDCYRNVQTHGFFVGNLAVQKPEQPYWVILIKGKTPEGFGFLFWAVIDTKPLDMFLSQLEIGEQGDAFIINREGNLQTSSRFYGNLHGQVSLPIPAEMETSGVIEARNKKNEPVIVGYAHIPDTSFILMAVKPKAKLMQPWFAARIKLVGFLLASIFVILLTIVGMATYLVNRIHTADQKRVEALHQAEYANKLASIGRLAAGVAHEINNPLAIINEKVGLIKDLFTLQQQYSQDPRLIGLVDSVITTVKRCGAITQRLLNFARHMEVSIKPIDLPELIQEMVDFHAKDAEYRCIGIFMDVSENLPQIESDQGNLQQIFLNLLNNAFAAMNDGGRLDIKVRQKDKDFLDVSFRDNGCGIADDDLKRIFEPFFATKAQEGTTGLGLSITYGLTQEIGGRISVQSKVGQGTCFTITLPLRLARKENRIACEY